MRTNLKIVLSIALGILCAIIVAVGVILFWQQDRQYNIRVLSQSENNQPNYVTLNTHEIAPLMDKYKNPYMGDASNMNGLFHDLLLVRAGVSIGIDADTFTVQVYYQATEEELQSGNVRTALAYNSVAAFTLIDNLQNIEYFFPGNNFVYTINRINVIDWFGTSDLAAYFPSALEWQNNFQNLLKDSEYMNQFFIKSFVAKDFQNPDFDGTNAAAAGVEPNASTRDVPTE